MDTSNQKNSLWKQLVYILAGRILECSEGQTPERTGQRVDCKGEDQRGVVGQDMIKAENHFRRLGEWFIVLFIASGLEKS